MTSNDCLRLCGGTFFIFFTRAMKEHGRTTGVLEGDHKRVTDRVKDAASISERNALKGLARIYYPSMTDLAYSTEKSNATYFKKCRQITAIPFDNETLKESFDVRVRKHYDEPLRAMENLVKAQIDAEGKGEQLVKSLLELIEEDDYVLEDAQFYIGVGGHPVAKKELRAESHFCLEAFLLGVWHYCIMHVPDNTVGVETYFHFYPSARESGSGGRHQFVNSIGNNPSRIVFLDRITAYYKRIPSSGLEQGIESAIDNYYSKYFHGIAKDISAVKTILFEETINFQDFYVCNGIRRRFYKGSEYRRERSTKARDDEPTIESVRELGLRIIVQGIGGMGKSMLMRHFMLDGIERYPHTGRIPIFVRLKDYAASNYEIVDFVFDNIVAYYPEVDKERIKKDIANGRIVLLFDGMDEINSAYRGQFETKLNRFLAVNQKLQVIISTRQFSKDIYASDFKIFMLMPLSKDKALQLVDKLPFRPHDPSKKAAFQKALDERLYRERDVFAKNPLLLTFMLMTYERYGGEETSMHSFYAEVYELLSTRHDNTKEGYDRVFKAGLRPERLRDIFAAFCAITYQNEELDFSHHDLVERFRKIIDRLPDPECCIRPDDIIEDVTSGVCMLYREGDRYYFHHRSFQEYFCALSFSKQSEEKLQSIGEFFEQRSHERGDVAIQMLCGIIPEKSEKYIFLPFLKDLVGKGYWEFLKQAYPFLYYEYGETDSFSVNGSPSYLYSFICKKYGIDEEIGSFELPFYSDLVEEEYVRAEVDGEAQIIDAQTLDILEREGRITNSGEDYDYTEIVGYTMYVQTEELLKEPEHFEKLIEMMDRVDFPKKVEFESAQRLVLEMEKRARLNPRMLIEYI